MVGTFAACAGTAGARMRASRMPGVQPITNAATIAAAPAAATRYLVLLEGRTGSAGSLPAGDLDEIYERAVAGAGG